eukprot:187023-Prorocentrum_minimum.AAC.1
MTVIIIGRTTAVKMNGESTTTTNLISVTVTVSYYQRYRPPCGVINKIELGPAPAKPGGRTSARLLLHSEEGDPGWGGLQGTGPRAGQLGGPAAPAAYYYVCVRASARPSPHTTPILPPLFHYTCYLEEYPAPEGGWARCEHLHDRERSGWLN